MPRLEHAGWQTHLRSTGPRRRDGCVETESPDGEQRASREELNEIRNRGVTARYPRLFVPVLPALRASDCKLNTFRARTNARHRDKLSANRFPYVCMQPIQADTDFLASLTFSCCTLFRNVSLCCQGRFYTTEERREERY